jgi:hypothetical protein
MAVKKYKRIKESKPAKFTGVVRLEEYSSQNLHKSDLESKDVERTADRDRVP